eukprot:4125464-Pyramimonas_sp.AAC.1
MTAEESGGPNVCVGRRKHIHILAGQLKEDRAGRPGLLRTPTLGKAKTPGNGLSQNGYGPQLLRSTDCTT